MPVIQVLNATPSSPERKRELISALTQTYAEVMRMRPDTVRVVIQEVDRDSWGVAGVTLADSGQNESLDS
ncbi:MAG: tautomerase family protein [Pseudonocardiaceae bacterium]